MILLAGICFLAPEVPARVANRVGNLCIFALVKARGERQLAQLEPVIAALDRYHKDQGHYPRSLDDLIPRYLPQIPRLPNPFSENPAYWPFTSERGEDTYVLQASLVWGVQDRIDCVDWLSYSPSGPGNSHRPIGRVGRWYYWNTSW